MEKLIKEISACRNIVNEIMNFGVSQDQILQIIYQLALELENREHLTEIICLVKKLKENIDVQSEEILNNSNLILPNSE